MHNNKTNGSPCDKVNKILSQTTVTGDHLYYSQAEQTSLPFSYLDKDKFIFFIFLHCKMDNKRPIS